MIERLIVPDITVNSTNIHFQEVCIEPGAPANAFDGLTLKEASGMLDRMSVEKLSIGEVNDLLTHIFSKVLESYRKDPVAFTVNNDEGYGRRMFLRTCIGVQDPTIRKSAEVAYESFCSLIIAFDLKY